MTDNPQKPYRAEIRFDLTAESPEQAREIAHLVASKVPAANIEVTAIFDEDWNEL